MAPRAKSLRERFPPKPDFFPSRRPVHLPQGSPPPEPKPDKPDIPGDRLLTREEVAYKLGVSPRTIYDMEKDGRLPPPIRLGGIWTRHPLSTIEALIDRLKAEAGK